jgi:c-di-GMP-binding flagellar brake protein YcgR
MGNTGERRQSRRYKIGLTLQFRVSEGRTISRWRAGKTCDMSTGGLVFRCGQELPVNAHIEMIIDWPSKQDEQPICLRAAGHVMRRQGRKIAVRMTFCRMVIEKPAMAPKAAASNSG